MSRLHFASVRNLFAGAALASAPEDDDDDGTQGNSGKDGPSAEAIDKAMAIEVDKAVTAANARWNTVMTSDAGTANPKAAARILNTSTMAADDIVATLGDLSPPAAAADADAVAARQARLERDRQALVGNDDADPKTGAAGGGRGARSGEGDAEKTAKAREARKAITERNNKALAGKGGVAANAPR